MIPVPHALRNALRVNMIMLRQIINAYFYIVRWLLDRMQVLILAHVSQVTITFMLMQPSFQQTIDFLVTPIVQLVPRELI